MNYCIECKFYHYNTAKKAFECSMSIGRISEIPCDSYVEDDMVWVKVPREHGRLIDADKLKQVMDDATENDKDNPFRKMMYSYVIQVLAKSPTVLEANE